MMVPGAALPYGSRRFGVMRQGNGGHMRRHNGVDVFAPAGSPVHAPSPGRVYIAAREYRPGFSGYGRVVAMRLDNGRHMLVSHLDQVLVHEGQEVAAGARIGTVGTTAFSRNDPTAHFKVSRPHVHIELADQRYPMPSTAERLDPTVLVFTHPKAPPAASGKRTEPCPQLPLNWTAPPTNFGGATTNSRGTSEVTSTRETRKPRASFARRASMGSSGATGHRARGQTVSGSGTGATPGMWWWRAAWASLQSLLRLLRRGL